MLDVLLASDRAEDLIATPAPFRQYEEVLKRPVQLRAAGLTEVQVDRRLAALASAAEPVDVHYRWRPQLSDPGDERVFEAVVNGRAEALVTYNSRHFATAAIRFGLRIARPVEVLGEMTR